MLTRSRDTNLSADRAFPLSYSLHAPNAFHLPLSPAQDVPQPATALDPRFSILGGMSRPPACRSDLRAMTPIRGRLPTPKPSPTNAPPALSLERQSVHHHWHISSAPSPRRAPSPAAVPRQLAHCILAQRQTRTLSLLPLLYRPHSAPGLAMPPVGSRASPAHTQSDAGYSSTAPTNHTYRISPSSRRPPPQTPAVPGTPILSHEDGTRMNEDEPTPHPLVSSSSRDSDVLMGMNEDGYERAVPSSSPQRRSINIRAYSTSTNALHPGRDRESEVDTDILQVRRRKDREPRRSKGVVYVWVEGVEEVEVAAKVDGEDIDSVGVERREFEGRATNAAVALERRRTRTSNIYIHVSVSQAWRKQCGVEAEVEVEEEDNDIDIDIDIVLAGRGLHVGIGTEANTDCRGAMGRDAPSTAGGGCRVRGSVREEEDIDIDIARAGDVGVKSIPMCTHLAGSGIVLARVDFGLGDEETESGGLMGWMGRRRCRRDEASTARGGEKVDMRSMGERVRGVYGYGASGKAKRNGGGKRVEVGVPGGKDWWWDGMCIGGRIELGSKKGVSSKAVEFVKACRDDEMREERERDSGKASVHGGERAEADAAQKTETTTRDGGDDIALYKL
ncbi:hypothetical protein R3P38DRAFT_3348880 [Favolaschia claudopus]|uniref:Uncharacterized protein n=1 Tax=Favolaschia claudopus TaxID=2862362 RepID=A0AAW0CNL6_9AGAR